MANRVGAHVTALEVLGECPRGGDDVLEQGSALRLEPAVEIVALREEEPGHQVALIEFDRAFELSALD